MKKNEVEGACDKYGEEDGWIQGFGEKAWRKKRIFGNWSWIWIILNGFERSRKVGRGIFICGSVSSPLCVWKLEGVCSQTQLCQLRCFNDNTRQLHASASTGHLQVVFKRTLGPTIYNITCAHAMEISTSGLCCVIISFYVECSGTHTTAFNIEISLACAQIILYIVVS